MKNNINKKITNFIWGGKDRKAQDKLKVIIKTPTEKEKGVRDPTIALDAEKNQDALENYHQGPTSVNAVDRT